MTDDALEEARDAFLAEAEGDLQKAFELALEAYLWALSGSRVLASKVSYGLVRGQVQASSSSS